MDVHVTVPQRTAVCRISVTKFIKSIYVGQTGLTKEQSFEKSLVRMHCFPFQSTWDQVWIWSEMQGCHGLKYIIHNTLMIESGSIVLRMASIWHVW